MSTNFIFFDHPSAIPIHDAWRETIVDLLPSKEHDRIRVISLPFEDMQGSAAEFDCLVSPGNSYGIMDGGIDMVFSRAFSGGGGHLALSRIVQDAIVDRYFGFAPPTSCTLVPIPEKLRNAQYPRCKVLASCPTMRIPMNVRWHEDLVYNTMWTLLAELEHWNASHADEEKIKTVAVPGLGTGIGSFDKHRCARQMVLAVKHFLEARSEEGRARLADRSWTTDWDNVIESAVDVDSDGDSD